MIWLSGEVGGGGMSLTWSAAVSMFDWVTIVTVGVIRTTGSSDVMQGVWV